MTDDPMTREREYESMFRANIRPIRAFTASMLSPEHVDDVVAATFMSAWQRFDDIPSDAQRPWLFGTARNHIRNARRTDRRHLALVDAIDTDPTWRGRSTDDGDRAEVHPVLDAIRDLDDDDRELMLMTGWFELTPNEIASILDEQPGTIRVRLHRVRRRLMNQLDAASEGGATA